MRPKLNNLFPKTTIDMVTRKEILGRLGEVMDPELAMSIVDLGLVYEVDVERKRKG